MRKLLFIAVLLFSVQQVNANQITLTGTVISNGQKMIGSRYMGYIKKVFVELGDHVKREDDLYEMESAEFDIMKSQADLALEQSKIVVEFWRKRLEILQSRKDKLEQKRSMMPMTDLDDLATMAENAEAMLESAQVMVEQMSIKAKQLATVFNYLKMKAPSDGVIVQKNIKVGDMVMPGMLTIMMVDTEDLEIDVSISEGIMKHIHKGDKVKVVIPSLEYHTNGRIKAVIPDANPMTHKIKIRVTFDRHGQNVFPGMYAKVIIRKPYD
ncbi:MAG: efflux RND transporter periplasmic adaptor subunit [Campylobacterota bacterium]|nr:efflux RND transporter periplasmic adaptor subunit [Campylobacterota bacterium]